ncbi:MAG: trypsin-like peptidase domain-containing protein [Clostridia bacterium]|nr:trypsin-like peptidase domain-containing protein [Clostridia bacterium]
MKKTGLKIALTLTLCLIFALCLISCDLLEIEDGTVRGKYFDFVSIDQEVVGDRCDLTVKATCPISLYEYTASLIFVGEDGDEFFETENVTEAKELSANEEIELSFNVEKKKCDSAVSYRLNITGKSNDKISSLKEKTFTVTYMYGGTVLGTEEVKGLSAPSGAELTGEYLSLSYWTSDEALKNRVDLGKQEICRDTTFYARADFNAEKTINKISTDINQSMVMVESTHGTSYGFGGAEVKSRGSGAIIYTDLSYAYVITNNHVVTNSAYMLKEIVVYDCYGNKHEAELCKKGAVDSKSEDYDLALLRFSKGLSEFEPIALAQKDAGVGALVVSLGSPNSQQNTITLGTVYKVDTSHGEITLNFPVTYHTAEIAHGSSGGALLNDRLELVGVNFAGYSQDKSFDNGLSVPVSYLREFLSRYTDIEL